MALASRFTRFSEVLSPSLPTSASDDDLNLIMSTWLERFVLTLLAGVLRATVLTNPWQLDRFQQAALIVAIVAISLFAARTIERAREVEGVVVQKPAADRSRGVLQPSPLAGSTANQSTALPQPLPNEHAVPAHDAEAAAEHYRRTSPRLKREEIRGAYMDYCERITARFGLSAWAPVNQLTRMVTTNIGDVEAFGRAETEVPSYSGFCAFTVV